MADEERKIIIDEDWKAQVQREKELARQRAEQEAKSAAAAAAPATGGAEPQAGAAPGAEAGAGAESEDEGEITLFLSLVQSLAAQALYALGLVGEPGAQQVMVDLRQAKYVIDTLMMLREKTQGRLTPAEQRQLTEAITELQQIYVVRSQQMHEQTLRQAGVDPNSLGQR